MAGVHAHDAPRLAQDDLDDAGVLVVGGLRQLLRERRRGDGAQIDQAAFRLRHHLLADDHDVAVGTGQATAVKGGEEQGGEIVTRPHHRYAGYGQDLQCHGPPR